MAAELDTTPQVVNIKHYAGDTLTLRVTAPDELVAGMTWNAQVRPARSSDQVDAEFTVVQGAPGTPTHLVLSADDAARLVGYGVLRREMHEGTLALMQQYVGEWDVQVSDNGNDPVRTLARGSITIELDVTRLP